MREPLTTKTVSVTDAYKKLNTTGHILLDVRQKGEVHAVGVKEALNIPLDQLESNLVQLKDFSSIHVICRSGSRSDIATQILYGNGLTQTANVVGGMIAWEQAGLPVIRN